MPSSSGTKRRSDASRRAGFLRALRLAHLEQQQPQHRAVSAPVPARPSSPQLVRQPSFRDMLPAAVAAEVEARPDTPPPIRPPSQLPRSLLTEQIAELEALLRQKTDLDPKPPSPRPPPPGWPAPAPLTVARALPARNWPCAPGEI